MKVAIARAPQKRPSVTLHFGMSGLCWCGLKGEYKYYERSTPEALSLRLDRVPQKGLRCHTSAGRKAVLRFRSAIVASAELYDFKSVQMQLPKTRRSPR